MHGDVMESSETDCTKIGSDGKLQWRPYAPDGAKRTKHINTHEISDQKFFF